MSAGCCHVEEVAGRDVVMKKIKSLCHDHRLPAAVISHAVRWHFRCHLSLRDIEELLFERGVVVNYESVADATNSARALPVVSKRGGASRAAPGVSMRCL